MMKLHTKLSMILAAAAGFSSPQTAFAYDWSIEANVLLVEPTYMPSGVLFTIDHPAGNCASGTFLAWNAKGADAQAKIANVNAFYAMLLTAKATRTKVRLFGNNTTCTIDHIHWLPN